MKFGCLYYYNMENNLFYAIAQRTRDGRYINMWINGSPRQERVLPAKLYDILITRGQTDLIPTIKETILMNYSIYLIDFVNAKIGHLSTIKTKEGSSIMEVISAAPNIIDAEARQEQLNQALNITAAPKEQPKKKEGELIFSNRKKKSSESENSFQQFLSNLQNFIR